MTLTQLEYIVALDTYRHFVLASEKCFVTQPTLSMQIQKLEEELDVKIFDRTKQPVIPTEIGASIIAQARITLREASVIRQVIAEQKDNMTGEIRIGIIPTLAPYLLPQLFKNIREKYPQINLVIKETITEEIVQELKYNRLDCGIVVTPLKDNSIKEDILFYEELFVYVSKKNALHDKKYVIPSEIDPNQLWLLEEGHCFRSQVLNLCELRKYSNVNFKYETGSIETLKRMVDKSDGITILPELAVMEFSQAQMKHVKRLKDPSPAREVSLVTHRDHVKMRLINSLKEEILSVIPKPMHKLQKKKVVEIN
ncbi:hydrogen peroxide-inducible genes activator [Chryseotalea sanaruensis]|uniref:Hydrogen peroxide-inducible genes activator n=1 Tax=Chryseotalea sanaruensis TaxID=2482724 RepID=A0A401UFH0_9BACT|nr:hydrogen peroxide-inducible genes activator [Chryseotalea sanaruensis]GCC53668.1 hydrogen peroxide-inducible genes activator [Chryseotalea sanaruensis]